jgi:two-component system, NarL family, sensor histidine kinase BarA
MTPGIRHRILLASVAPLGLITLILAYFTIDSRLHDVRAALDERGELLAEQLADKAEFPLLIRDLDQLNDIAERMLDFGGVEYVEFADATGDTLAATGMNEIQGTGNLKLYSAFVYARGIQTEDYEKSGPTHTRNIGTVRVGLSLEPLQLNEQRILRTSLLIATGGLLFSLLLALWISHGIARPLEDIASVVGRLRRGDLHARVTRHSSGELANLGHGVNRLANTIAESEQILKQQVVQATEQLNRTVDELTHKNKELAEAHEAAETLGRHKFEFLARMSHEIRTPLNAIMGFSNLVAKHEDSTERHQYIGMINRSSEHLRNIIDDILTFAHLDSGSMKMHVEKFDIRSCVEQAVEMLSPRAHAKSLEFVLLINTSVPTHWLGDPFRITQILENLINNAIKFTNEGHVAIQVHYQATSIGGRLIFEVEDTGCGIPEGKQDTIFDAFAQADNSMTRHYGGTGLGLAISKQLALRMGGDIHLFSSSGQGTRFEFILDGAGQPGAAEPVPLAQPLRNTRLLVYDTHPLARRAVRNVLLCAGAEIFSCGDVSRCQELLRTMSFDAVVLGMPPGVSAPEAQHRANDALGAWPGPRLVLLAPLDGLELEAKTTDVPLRILAKPALGKALLEATAAMLERKLNAAQLDTTDVPTQAAEAGIELSGRRILVVEDNAFNQKLIIALLHRTGARVDLAGNGTEAIQFANTTRYDLIFMDIHMPDMDGITAARRIREQELGDHETPIVAVTADVFSNCMEGEHSPISDILHKPFGETGLFAILRKHLEKTPDTREASPEPVVDPVMLPDEFRHKALEEVVRLGRAIQSSLSRSDWPACRELIHQLTGISGYFALDTIDELAHRLRFELARGDHGEAVVTCSNILSSAGDLQTGFPPSR